MGRAEVELIRSSKFRAFSPRLPGQPYFYPVLSEEYAIQIARDWNTRDEASAHEGYVLKFKVRTAFLSRYDVHVVGNSTQCEYWIPAEDLEKLNLNIIGTIEVIRQFRRRNV